MKKGGFMKDALILFAITLIAGACLGGVYEVTKEPIQQAKIAASMETYRLVYADVAEFKFDQPLQDAVAREGETFADGLGLGKVSVDNALNAVDASGNVIGRIITATSGDGYGGNIKISVGLTVDGTITGVGFLELAETPGLGMKAQEPEFIGQFDGKQVESFVLTKGGASADNEIDAIAGATITSTAVTNAVNAVLHFAANCAPRP